MEKHDLLFNSDGTLIIPELIKNDLEKEKKIKNEY